MKMTKRERDFMKLIAKRDRIVGMINRLAKEADKIAKIAREIGPDLMTKEGRGKKLSSLRRIKDPIVVVDLRGMCVESVIMDGLHITTINIDNTLDVCPVCGAGEQNYDEKVCDSCGYRQDMDSEELYTLVEEREFDKIEEGDKNGK